MISKKIVSLVAIDKGATLNRIRSAARFNTIQTSDHSYQPKQLYPCSHLPIINASIQLTL